MKNFYLNKMRITVFMNKNFILKNLLKLFIVLVFPLFLSFHLSASNYSNDLLKTSKTTLCQISQNTPTWALIYSDTLIKVYYTQIVCDSVNSVLLKFENLTSQELNISYKIWNASLHTKIMNLPPYRTIEGICASIYDNHLVESIPPGSSIGNINVLISY